MYCSVILLIEFQVFQDYGILLLFVAGVVRLDEHAGQFLLWLFEYKLSSGLCGLDCNRLSLVYCCYYSDVVVDNQIIRSIAPGGDSSQTQPASR
jgi:hypothetical protein